VGLCPPRRTHWCERRIYRLHSKYSRTSCSTMDLLTLHRKVLSKPTGKDGLVSVTEAACPTPFSWSHGPRATRLRQNSAGLGQLRSCSPKWCLAYTSQWLLQPRRLRRQCHHKTDLSHGHRYQLRDSLPLSALLGVEPEWRRRIPAPNFRGAGHWLGSA
jgi:hypothetical protein